MTACFNWAIPHPLGVGSPLKEEELEKPGGFSNSGYHIDTPPLEVERFIQFFYENLTKLHIK